MESLQRAPHLVRIRGEEQVDSSANLSESDPGDLFDGLPKIDEGTVAHLDNSFNLPFPT